VHDSDIKHEFNENYQYANQYWAPFVKDAQAYTLAASGLTWDDNERKMLQKEGREPLELNIMRRPLSFFSGWLRDNVNSIVYSPVEGSDQKTSDQFTELSYYIWDKGNGYPKFLDAYDEAFKSGISLCGIAMDYSKDFINGDIKFFNRTYNSFYLDPTFASIDLEDCGYAIMRDLVTVQCAKQLLPFVDSNIIEGMARSFRDDKFMSYRPNNTASARSNNLLSYDQYYRRTNRPRKYLIDMESSFYRDITDLPKEEVKKLEMGIGRLNSMSEEFELLGDGQADIPNVEIKTVDRPYIELHIMLNGELVYSGEDKTGIVEKYPFAPCICYMEPSIWIPSQRIQGMASCQWSAQRQFNKRHMKIIDMMDSVISTGYKYLIGSVPDPSDMQQSGQNRLIGVDAENAPEGLNSVQQLQSSSPDAGFLAYQEVLDKLTLTLGNVTEASLGMDEKRNTLVSGRLAQVQIAQNLLTNRKVFDNVDTTQQVLGGLVLQAIQKNYPPGKVQRILAENPTEQFYENNFEQYDAVIKEGVRSKSQKDAYYYELVNLKRDGIVDVPQSEIIRALGMAGVSDLEEAIKAQEEQQAQQQAKVEEQERMALELANAQKEQMLSLAQERRARVISDISLSEERASEAEENRAQAALARAKTITEIAAMEQDQILKVLAFVEHLEDQEKKDRDNISNQIYSTADLINSETEGSSENKVLSEAQQEISQLTQENQGVGYENE